MREAMLAGYRRLRRLKNRTLNLLDSPVVVLTYHRVTIPAFDPHRLAVSPENFRAQMIFLQRNFPIVRFEDDWKGVTEPAVAVTFDDGYADNFRQALPILEEVGLPATFFVSTGTLGTLHEFWWDELERVVLGEVGHPGRFRLEDQQYGRLWSTGTRRERLVLHDDIHRLARKVGASRREDWLEQLRLWAGLDRIGREANRPLRPEEVRLLAASRWATIGAHTVTHTPLAFLAEEEQRREIIGSKRQLEELLAGEVTVFSYPFGTRKDYDRTSIRICREAGFRRAAANFPGQGHRWTDPLQVPRQLVRDWDLPTFAAEMERFWT
jgi:peptidoglycan/xylan/chitin deacetylase (PgdA/CDA1 family)